MVNLVELLAATYDDYDCAFDQPCKWGNRVEGHAVYCHNKEWSDAPRKCRNSWYTGGENKDEDCPGFSPNPDYKEVEMDSIVKKRLDKRFKEGRIPKDLFMTILKNKKLPISCEVLDYEYRLTNHIDYELAGLFYHKDWNERVKKIIDILKDIEGIPMRLVPEAGNEYDPYALHIVPSKALVELCVENGYELSYDPIGYVPQKYTKIISNYINAGNIVATILTLGTAPDPVGDIYPHVYLKTGIYKKYNKNEKTYTRVQF